MNLKQTIRKYLTEFIGTFFLVLIMGLAKGTGNDFEPIAVGSALMVLLYMGLHVSGAHYNPAVTLAVLIQGGIKIGDAGIYLLVHILGAFAGAAVVGPLVIDDSFTFLISKAGSATPVEAILVEVLFTFLLVLVYLNVTRSRGTKDNSFYGLATGFTLWVCYFAGGGISGGAFNPAVGVAPNVLSGEFGDLFIYTLGPLLGGALAGFFFNFQEEVVLKS